MMERFGAVLFGYFFLFLAILAMIISLLFALAKSFGIALIIVGVAMLLINLLRNATQVIQEEDEKSNTK